MTTGHRSHWSGLSLKPCVLPIGSIQAYIQQSESGNYTLLANAQWERWGESGSTVQLSFCFICFVVVVVGMWKAVKSNQRGVQCDMCDSWFLIKCLLIPTKIYEEFENSSTFEFAPAATPRISPAACPTWHDMKFHPDKCKVLRVGRKRRHDYIIYGQTLQIVVTSKYLGVTLSSDLI